MSILGEKNCKNRLSVEGSTLEPPFTLSDWGLRSQTPALLLPLTITTLSSSFPIHFIPLKKEPSNYSRTNVLPLLLSHFCIYFLIQTL